MIFILEWRLDVFSKELFVPQRVCRNERVRVWKRLNRLKFQSWHRKTYFIIFCRHCCLLHNPCTLWPRRKQVVNFDFKEKLTRKASLMYSRYITIFCLELPFCEIHVLTKVYCLQMSSSQCDPRRKAELRNRTNHYKTVSEFHFIICSSSSCEMNIGLMMHTRCGPSFLCVFLFSFNVC